MPVINRLHFKGLKEIEQNLLNLSKQINSQKEVIRETRKIGKQHALQPIMAASGAIQRYFPPRAEGRALPKGFQASVKMSKARKAITAQGRFQAAYIGYLLHIGINRKKERSQVLSLFFTYNKKERFTKKGYSRGTMLGGKRVRNPFLAPDKELIKRKIMVIWKDVLKKILEQGQTPKIR